MIRSLVVFSSALAALALTSCAAIDDLENLSTEAYMRTCDKFGFVRGTDAFANCVLQQQALDEASDVNKAIIRALDNR
ncbi:hypothetical protein [Burkholderia ubonensis]|uniref:hypothetical protein n=1 Tax=Burkholderia ubonensis TaxID=101571 RepID=UPI0012FA4C65|nr:hypothetical protein [Burkholderia ubonensis]